MLKIKRVLWMTLIGVVIFGMLSSVFAAPSDWAEDFLKSMLLEDLLSETVSDSSKFQQAITREEFAELVIMIYAKADEISVDELNAWNPFGDTNNDMVAKAYNLGIVSGTGRDSQDRLLFSPHNNVTRQEMAVMLVKALNKLNINTAPKMNLSFDDTDQISDWALDAMRFVVEADILSGIGNNQVGPRQYATREQALVLINKLGVKYGWIRNELMIPKFFSQNSSEAYGFRVPNYDASQLRAYSNNNHVTYIISYLVSDPVVDIKSQQRDLINILVNSSSISYDSFKVLNTYIEGCYDFSARRFKEGTTVYLHPTTGMVTSYEPGKPFIKVSYNGEFKIEYHN